MEFSLYPKKQEALKREVEDSSYELLVISSIFQFIFCNNIPVVVWQLISFIEETRNSALATVRGGGMG